ncbi:MAG: VTT domain-containing protein [Anaerolineales bacterium]|nr:VTT domain-containing protein [Anaerolineales bacterium]
MVDWIDFLQAFWQGLLQGRLPQLGVWTYLLLGFLIVLQGPLATLLGGAAASAGLLRPFWVLVAGMGGNLTADVFWYSIGRAGKLHWLRRVAGRLGLGQARLDQLLAGMREHSRKLLLLAKLSAGFAVPALVAAGLARVPWRRWFPVVFLGETLWTGTLLLIGYYATEAIKRVEMGLHYVALAVGLLLLGALLWWLSHHWQPRHQQPE